MAIQTQPQLLDAERTQIKPDAKIRLNFLDSIRGLAALVVVFFMLFESPVLVVLPPMVILLIKFCTL